MNEEKLDQSSIKRLYGALRSELNNLSVQNIRNAAAAAGIDVSRITAKAEGRTGLGSRAEVMPAIDRLFGQMENEEQIIALPILAERIIEDDPDSEERIQTILGKHGFQFIGGSFIPIEMLDLREKEFLPITASSEISRAMARLISSDESGAITAACGAVNLITQKIYKNYDLGYTGRSSFQTKINTSLKELQVYDQLNEQFIEIESG